MNMDNSIALDLIIMNMDNSIMNMDNSTGFKYSQNPFIRAEALRTISLKFHNLFRVKLFVYRFFERTLSMAETTLLLVWNTKILSPLNADHESLEVGQYKFFDC